MYKSNSILRGRTTLCTCHFWDFLFQTWPNLNKIPQKYANFIRPILDPKISNIAPSLYIVVNRKSRQAQLWEMQVVMCKDMSWHNPIEKAMPLIYSKNVAWSSTYAKVSEKKLSDIVYGQEKRILLQIYGRQKKSTRADIK
jgi:hypothetical protein